MRNRVIAAEERLARAWGAVSPQETLSTVEGEDVRVVYPGRRNRASGPDFLDAVLETEHGEVRGAVEVHRRTSDWERHGHGADPRYGAVVLHVVGHHDGAASRPPGGTQLPLLELAAVGASGDSGSRLPCADPAAATTLMAALAGAGDRRFVANVARLRAALERDADDRAEDQVAYEEVAAALGYSRNLDPMRALAQAVPLADVRRWSRVGAGHPALRAEALLLGAGGLLPSQRHLPARRRRDVYAETVERVWREAGRAAALRAYRWDHGQVRPENGPVRRVVGLARVALQWPPGGVADALRQRLAGPSPRRRLADLICLPCVEGYWMSHWDFGVAGSHGGADAGMGVPVRSQPAASVAARGAVGGSIARARARAGPALPALIGPSRAADVVVNVLLPLAAALAERDGRSDLARTAHETYRTHPPLAENWITRLVRERADLGGARDAIVTAREQQGLIDVYERTCHALRCAECVLSSAPRDAR